MSWLRNLVLQSQFLGDLFFPNDSPEWKDKLAALLPIIGLPVAFWLWFWRDQNAQSTIESSRKDVNLKEFQHVFNSASGLFGSDVDESAKITTQIAALYHLRDFLRGEYGDSFRRPALELFLAGHRQAVAKSGLAQLLIERRKSRSTKILSINECISSAREKLSEVDVARMNIIREEHKYIFGSEFPLFNRCFDFIDLGYGHDFYHILITPESNFRGSSFIGSNMSSLIANDCDFEGCDFRGSTLNYCELKNSRFWEANLDDVDLRHSDITGANFATIDPRALASCFGTYFDKNTWLEPYWGHISEEKKAEARQAWTHLDAEFVEDEDSDQAET